MLLGDLNFFRPANDMRKKDTRRFSKRVDFRMALRDCGSAEREAIPCFDLVEEMKQGIIRMSAAGSLLTADQSRALNEL